MSRKRAAVARTARGARSSDGHTAPNVANAADTAAGVLGRSAARAGLAVPLYLEALQAGAMARLEDSRAGQLFRHDLNRLLLAAERLKHECDRFADDITGTNYNGFGAAQWNCFMFEHCHYAKGRARAQAGAPGHQRTGIRDMKAIHVFNG